MLENAMTKDHKDGGSKVRNASNSSQKQSFLKRKEKYDPKKALEKGSANVKERNIDSKRIFGKKSKANTDLDDDEDEDRSYKKQSKSK
jgi:hypothetical protein